MATAAGVVHSYRHFRNINFSQSSQSTKEPFHGTCADLGDSVATWEQAEIEAIELVLFTTAASLTCPNALGPRETT